MNADAIAAITRQLAADLKKAAAAASEAADYLDNAKPAEWSRHKFAGVLSALQKVGAYRPNTDPDFADVFGDVKLA